MWKACVGLSGSFRLDIVYWCILDYTYYVQRSFHVSHTDILVNVLRKHTSAVEYVWTCVCVSICVTMCLFLIMLHVLYMLCRCISVRVCATVWVRVEVQVWPGTLHVFPPSRWPLGRPGLGRRVSSCPPTQPSQKVDSTAPPACPAMPPSRPAAPCQRKKKSQRMVL